MLPPKNVQITIKIAEFSGIRRNQNGNQKQGRGIAPPVTGNPPQAARDQTHVAQSLYKYFSNSARIFREAAENSEFFLLRRLINDSENGTVYARICGAVKNGSRAADRDKST